jgi:hypothetical protein
MGIVDGRLVWLMAGKNSVLTEKVFDCLDGVLWMIVQDLNDRTI